MILQDTVNLMLSEDYKERFKAEYFQLKIRTQKLQHMVDNWEHLTFTPTCPFHMYVDQLEAMYSYKNILENRAKIEGVELNE